MHDKLAPTSQGGGGGGRALACARRNCASWTCASAERGVAAGKYAGAEDGIEGGHCRAEDRCDDCPPGGPAGLLDAPSEEDAPWGALFGFGAGGGLILFFTLALASGTLK